MKNSQQEIFHTEKKKMDLTDKTVTIIGAARSGLASARLITRLHGKAKISEQSSENCIPFDFKEWASQHYVKMEFNGHTRLFIEHSDLLVLSPGVRYDALPIQWAKEKGIPVMGEVELAYQFCPRPVIAVTGSNGKTTVSTLISEIIKKAGMNVSLCGNIGFPFADFVLDLDSNGYVVLEISSFQLESIVYFKPFIAVFLNFSQNHLDRHKDLQEYFDAKKRIFMNQNESDYAVLNERDPMVKELATQIRAQVRFFNSPASKDGGRIQNPNYLAAQEAAKILGISEQVCQEVFEEFKGVKHRLEWVRTIKGVDFINDSKSTTAEAGRWAMENMTRPMIMICGGRDKNIDFTVLRDLVKKKVKKMIVIGEARQKLKDVFGNVVPLEECDGLEQAVSRALNSAAPGDCVVLSPMCTSFDMFKNYEERGEVFKEIVHRLKP